MAYNRSVFPEGGYDIFKESYDLPPSLKPLALEYQALKTKANLTPTEVQRLSELTTLLQDFIITPEKLNHFQDAVSSIQKFFKENIMDFVVDGEKIDAYISSQTAQMTNLIKIKPNITILTANWVDDTVTSGFWTYEIADVDITANTVVDVNVHLADLEKASDIKSANLSSTGKVILYADGKPTEDILCDLKLIRQVV